MPLRLLLFVMLPITGFGIVLRREVTELLFGYGRFDATAIDLTAATLFTFMFGLAAHALIAVLARAFYAHQDTRTPVAAGIVSVVVNTTLSVILSGPLGLPGIGLAIAIGAWIEMSILLVLLRRRLPALSLRPVFLVAFRSLFATILRLGGGIRAARRPRARRRQPAGHVLAARPFPDRRRCRRRRLRGPRRDVAHPGADVYRRGHGRPAPTPAPSVSQPPTRLDPDDPTAWDAFVSAADPGSYLQLSPWAQVKAVNGWSAVRLASDAGRIGAQVLVRRPRPLPWAFAYSPRGPVAHAWSPDAIAEFAAVLRAALPERAGRVSHIRIDPEIETRRTP